MENQKCNQKGCDEIATHSYVWPTDGETKHSCQPHARQARNIGSVMGYTIKLRELAPDAPKETIIVEGKTIAERMPSGDGPSADQLKAMASRMPKHPPEIEEFCEQVGPVDPDSDGNYVYLYSPNQLLRVMGFLVWGAPDSDILSVKVNGLEQIASELGKIPIRLLVNPFHTYEQALEWLERGLRLPYTNLALPILQVGGRIQVRTNSPCVVCICGTRLVGG